jgi:hypothetical protein
MPASEVIENVVPQSTSMLPDEDGARHRNVRFIDQIGQARIDKLELASWVRKDRHMFSARRLRFKGPSAAAGDVARFPDEPKILSPNDDGSSRMSDEGCPNERPSVDDATGYSKEEEEDNSIGCEEVL